MTIKTIKDIDLRNKRVVIRVDFNVPIQDHKIASDTRIRASLPTIQYALDHHAKVILLSHLGRPKEGEPSPELSLEPIAEKLTQLLNKPVRFVRNWLNQPVDLADSEIVLCENVRFQPGETKNDPILSKKIASLGDIFVMDAFATAHRAESSTVGVTEFIPVVCAGLLLAEELEALGKALKNPARPLAAIIGGSKISTKLTVLSKLLEKTDYLIVGGGIANTFLAASQLSIGKSLNEPELINQASDLLRKAQECNVEILLPEDVMVAKDFNPSAKATLKKIQDVQPDEMILDIGPQTIKRYSAILQQAKTILWNGPVGVFEFPEFANGTKALAKAIAESSAFSVAGGGDTLSAIEKFEVADRISYISTGGGAFLEFVEGRELPAVKALENKS